MPAITIGTEHRAGEIVERLTAECGYLQSEGVGVQLALQNRGNFTFVDLDLQSDQPEQEALCRHYLAAALSDLIVEKWEEDLIRRIIRSHYYYFSRDEQDRICTCAGKNLAGAGGDERTLHDKLHRKSRILHRLRDYLDSSTELVVEGFLHFRLRDYLEELEDAVDRAVDDFLMEREQREFIRLLKYFVETQEPRVDEVHVLIRAGGSFQLVDATGSTLRSEALEEFLVDVVDSEVNQEDLLISALITLAPRRVTVHRSTQPRWEDGVETILAVFEGRVNLCRTCPLCATGSAAQKAPQS